MKLFDQFLVSAVDKKFLDSATFTEHNGVTSYKITSNKKTLMVHVKSNKEALLQDLQSKTLRHLKSNSLAKVLPYYVVSSLESRKTFKTPYGVFSNVSMAPVSKKRVLASAADLENGIKINDDFMIAPEGEQSAVFVRFGDDWCLLRNFDSEDEARFMVEKLLTSLTPSSVESESCEECTDLVPVEDPLLIDAINEYADPEEAEEFFREPSLENLPVAEDVEFQTASGKRFIVSHDETNITLGLYNLLRQNNAEYSLLLLPSLFEANAVKIQSSVLSKADLKEAANSIFSSYALFPKASLAPKAAGITNISQSFSLTKADKKVLSKANRILSGWDQVYNTKLGRQLDNQMIDDAFYKAQSKNKKEFSDFVKENIGDSIPDADIQEFFTAVNSSTKRTSITSAAEDGIPSEEPTNESSDTNLDTKFEMGVSNEDSDGTSEDTDFEEDLFIPGESGAFSDLPDETVEEANTEIHETLEAFSDGKITEADVVAAIGESLIEMGVEAAEASETAESLSADEKTLGEEAFLESSSKRTERVKSSADSDQVIAMGLAESAYKEGEVEKADATLRAIGMSVEEIEAYHSNWDGEVKSTSSVNSPVVSKAKLHSAFVLKDTMQNNRVVSSPYENEDEANADANAMNEATPGRFIVEPLGD